MPITEICDRCGAHCEWQGIPFNPEKDCTWLAIKEHRNSGATASKPAIVSQALSKAIGCNTDGDGGKGSQRVVTAPATKATHKESRSGRVTESRKVVIDSLTKKIWELAAKKLSTRQIAEQLRTEGIFVSHMTVARRLQTKMGL